MDGGWLQGVAREWWSWSKGLVATCRGGAPRVVYVCLSSRRKRVDGSTVDPTVLVIPDSACLVSKVFASSDFYGFLADHRRGVTFSW